MNSVLHEVANVFYSGNECVILSEVRVFAHEQLKEFELDCESECMIDVSEWYSPQHLEAYA